MKATTGLPLFLQSLFCLLLLTACEGERPLFRSVSADRSGIAFNNRIEENDSINPIDVTNIYNGGGVGVADFNNDGLQDLYFTGNLVPNQLYLNKGDMRFEDVTAQAGVDGAGRWSRGVSVVDLNNDGWQDLYISASMIPDSARRRNLLYINQGAGKDGLPRFREMAAAYGLDDATHSTMAAFFDYDNDSDLDMYLVVNEILQHDIPSNFRPKITDGSHPSTGRLYRNEGSDSLGHPHFTNITHAAGLTIEGYGHGVNISDFNLDGWKDIFVTNDFNSNDLLYINNGDGTFTDKAASYFKHTSANGMGQDVVDINNDGLSDVVELDMSPGDNYRKKMMMNGSSYQSYQNSDYYGYQYQYVRNTLQLNQGPRIEGGDSVGDPIFSDIGFLAGVAETDWSWTPLVADFDNDGFRDIVVTNGFPKDITDHDFIAFRKESFAVATKAFTLSQIPQVKLHNYGYRNNGDLTFTDATDSWGLSEPTFSTGAAYADLDNDGDLDMVVNNINDPAALYENTLMQQDEKPHYLTVKLKGTAPNVNGLGTWVEVYYGGRKQVYEQTPYRGYLSSIQPHPHFGLDTVSRLDSVVVKWPGGRKQKLTNVATDQVLEVTEGNARDTYQWALPQAANALLREVTAAAGIRYQHKQRDFIDFNIQKLLPHKFSEYGPALAAGDVNGDGLDDLVVGGNYTQPAQLLVQGADGTFAQRTLDSSDEAGLLWQDMGITLFDAEGDGDLDCYRARGGNEGEPGTAAYGDRLLLNDGKGGFTPAPTALPQLYTSKSCVRAADYDGDGDLDLFLGGRVLPGQYPRPVSSHLLRNDSRNGQVRFTDVTASIAPALTDAGLVCDALWTDFDNDGAMDLLLAGEWMPLKFLRNEKGRFRDITAGTELAGKTGWWNSLLPGDFDSDGDIDYLAGNLGLNSFYRASENEPVRIYAKDFDNNGSYDAIPTLYLPASHEDPERREYPAHTRDDITKQLISFKAKFQTYKAYASAPFEKMLTPEERKDVLVREANHFANSYIENLGGGKFRMTALPMPAQFACFNGMVAEDVDGDGHLDVVVSGNDFGAEVSVGRYDACNGLVLKGDGRGSFRPLSILQSGLFLPGNGKAMVQLRGAGGRTLVAASQNKGALRLFELKQGGRSIPLHPQDRSVVVHYRDGRKQKREANHGASFLSQSARFIRVGAQAVRAEVRDAQGNVRTIAL